jgi:hypothetical protein
MVAIVEIGEEMVEYTVCMETWNRELSQSGVDNKKSFIPAYSRSSIL